MPVQPESAILPPMSHFAAETVVESVEPGRWSTRLSSHWNIGENSNGGYALTPVLRAVQELVDQPDPITVTTHFFRPGRGDCDGEVTAEILRAGRRLTSATGSLSQEGKTRLTVLAAFGDLSGATVSEHDITSPPPNLPPPDECLLRSGTDQGVELPIMDRADVRIRPEHAKSGGHHSAELEGWIRFADGTEPTAMALPFFADAFPPSVFSLMGHVGWVPTVELTVHVRRRPVPGWLCARFECDDLHDGRLIESGRIWDSNGALVAQSRQIGLLLTD